VATAWGAVGLFVKGVDLDAAGIVTWRVALAAATVAALAGVVGRVGLLHVPAGRRRVLAGASVLLAAHWWLFFETIKLSTVTVGVLFAYLAPVFLAAPRAVAPAGAPDRAQRRRPRRGPGGDAARGRRSRATARRGRRHGLLTGLSYALLIVLGKVLRRDVSGLGVAFWQYAGVAVLLAPVAVAGGGLQPASGRQLAALVVLGVGLTGVCGLLYVLALGHVSAQTMGILSYLEPVSAAVLAALVLDETFGLRTAVGGALVLAAGLTVALQPAAAPEPTPVRRRAVVGR
jgi:drug/metabolite transporter (DMT)-like permease